MEQYQLAAAVSIIAFSLGGISGLLASGVGKWKRNCRIMVEVYDAATLRERHQAARIAALISENRDYRAEIARRNAPLIAANAARKAKAAARRTEAQARTESVHAELREMVNG